MTLGKRLHPCPGLYTCAAGTHSIQLNMFSAIPVITARCLYTKDYTRFPKHTRSPDKPEALEGNYPTPSCFHNLNIRDIYHSSELWEVLTLRTWYIYMIPQKLRTLVSPQQLTLVSPICSEQHRQTWKPSEVCPGASVTRGQAELVSSHLLETAHRLLQKHSTLTLLNKWQKLIQGHGDPRLEGAHCTLCWRSAGQHSPTLLGL